MTNFFGNLSRRELLKLSAVGALGLPVSGWLDRLAAHAAVQSPGNRPKHKSCILLFMTGGPSHIDTFDPKPENKSSEFKPIATAVPGIQLCENLPRVAKVANELALLRGMSTSEGSHGRARYYMHTGYREGVGGVDSSQHGRHRFPVPRRTGGPAAQLRLHRRPVVRGGLCRTVARAGGGGRSGPGHREHEARRRHGRVRPPGQPAGGRGERLRRSAGHAFGPGAPGHLPPGSSADALGKGQGVRPGPGAGRDSGRIRPEPIWRWLPAGSPVGRERRFLRRGQPRQLGHAPR